MAVGGDREVKLTFRITAEGVEILDALGNSLGKVADKTRDAAEKGVRGWQAWALAVTGVNQALQLGHQLVSQLDRAILGPIHHFDELNTLARRIGSSARELEPLDLAARTAGSSIETITTAIGRLQRRISEMKDNPNTDFARLFGNLNLQDKGPIESFKLVAERVANVTNETDRMRLGWVAFDRVATSIMPTLRALKDNADFGASFQTPQSVIDNAARTREEVTKLAWAWGQVKVQMGAEAAPIIKTVAEYMQTFVTHIHTNRDSLMAWRDVISVINDTVIILIETLKTLKAVMPDPGEWSTTAAVMKAIADHMRGITETSRVTEKGVMSEAAFIGTVYNPALQAKEKARQEYNESYNKYYSGGDAGEGEVTRQLMRLDMENKRKIKEEADAYFDKIKNAPRIEQRPGGATGASGDRVYGPESTSPFYQAPGPMSLATGGATGAGGPSDPALVAMRAEEAARKYLQVLAAQKETQDAIASSSQADLSALQRSGATLEAQQAVLDRIHAAKVRGFDIERQIAQTQGETTRDLNEQAAAQEKLRSLAERANAEQTDFQRQSESLREGAIQSQAQAGEARIVQLQYERQRMVERNADEKAAGALMQEQIGAATRLDQLDLSLLIAKRDKLDLEIKSLDVARAATAEAARMRAELVVTNSEIARYSEGRGKAIEDLTRTRKAAEQVTYDAAGGFSGGISQAVEGSIIGGRKFQFDDIAKSMSGSFISALIKAETAKNAWDVRISDNFSVKLPGFAQAGANKVTSIFGRMFDWLSGSGESSIFKLGDRLKAGLGFVTDAGGFAGSVINAAGQTLSTFGSGGRSGAVGTFGGLVTDSSGGPPVIASGPNGETIIANAPSAGGVTGSGGGGGGFMGTLGSLGSLWQGGSTIATAIGGGGGGGGLTGILGSLGGLGGGNVGGLLANSGVFSNVLQLAGSYFGLSAATPSLVGSLGGALGGGLGAIGGSAGASLASLGATGAEVAPALGAALGGPGFAGAETAAAAGSAAGAGLGAASGGLTALAAAAIIAMGIRRITQGDVVASNEKSAGFQFGYTEPRSTGEMVGDVTGKGALAIIPILAVVVAAITAIVGGIINAVYKPPTAEGMIGSKLAEVFKEAGFKNPYAAGGRDNWGSSHPYTGDTDQYFPQVPMPASYRAIEGIGEYGSLMGSYFENIKQISTRGDVDYAINRGPMQTVMNLAAAMALSQEDTRNMMRKTVSTTAGTFESGVLEALKFRSDVAMDTARGTGAVRFGPEDAQGWGNFRRNLAALTDSFNELPKSVNALILANTEYAFTIEKTINGLDTTTFSLDAFKRILAAAIEVGNALQIGSAAGTAVSARAYMGTPGAIFSRQVGINAAGSASSLMQRALDEGIMGKNFTNFTASVGGAFEMFRKGDYEAGGAALRKAAQEFAAGIKQARMDFEQMTEEAPEFARLVNISAMAGQIEGMQAEAYGLRTEARQMMYGTARSPRQAEAMRRNRLGEIDAALAGLRESEGGINTPEELGQARELIDERSDIGRWLGQAGGSIGGARGRRMITEGADILQGSADMLTALGVDIEGQLESLGQNTTSTDANTEAVNANTAALTGPREVTISIDVPGGAEADAKAVRDAVFGVLMSPEGQAMLKNVLTAGVA